MMQIQRGKKYYIYKIIQTIISVCYHRPLGFIELCSNVNKYCVHESYFPEFPQKSKIKILWEQFVATIRYGYPNKYYFPYGFDVKSNKEMAEYIHYMTFAQIRDDLNQFSMHNSTYLLRNKLAFGIFTSGFGINSGNNIALLHDEGVFIISDKRNVSVEEFMTRYPSDYFVKLIDGECGCGIFQLKIEEDGTFLINGSKSSIEQLNQLIKGGRYIVQAKIKQHVEMNRLYPHSINTIRLVTIRNVRTNKVEVFPSILRMGANGSFVDNTSLGGLAVGVDLETGGLFEYGYYKPEFGTRTTEHPNTKVSFSEFVIPYIQEAKEQAIFLHAMLPELYSIGWDIAISENGPIFIEGNDNWEINGPQICNGGLKNIFYHNMKF